MKVGSLAHGIMMMASKHEVQAGQPLPAEVFDLFLDEHPEQIGEALMELYMEELLQEVPHDVDLLTQKGVEYIYG